MEKVHFAACPDYGPALAPAVERLFAAAGWLGGRRFAGKRVLLKPNLLTDRPPEQAVTTHPELVRAVIRLLKRLGADVSVGDSPASTANLQQVWAKSGIAAVCSEESVPLVAFEKSGGESFERGGFSFSVSRPVLEADLLVNLPKVKSHSLTALTAAVKNLYGSVPGYAKTALHKRYPKPEAFGRLLQEIWKTLPPSVTLADAVVGMDGQGPANGRPKPMRFLAASESPYAMDRALCRVLKIDPRRVPYLSGVPGDVELCGEVPAVDSFEIPSGAHLLRLLPDWLIRTAGGIVWIRPAFDPSLCVGCGRCVAACPMHALRLGAGRRPALDRKACISCACCHEVCPRGAIRMTQSAVLRLLKVFKGIN
jgi:uncharacterized protein (DUF362 family)/NAD-dependent dihydropyrimidine dehydrogenase PreA subunit